METNSSLAWNLYVELRKEIVATQQLRSRAIEFKITLVGAAIALFVANRDKLGDDRLLILPAFAAIFFDFLIASYNVSIKRQSKYLRKYVEPQLKEEFKWPTKGNLWENHASQPEQRQMLSVIANLGLSVLAALPGAFILAQSPTPLNLLALGLFLSLLGYLAIVYGHLGYYGNILFRHKVKIESEETESESPGGRS